MRVEILSAGNLSARKNTPFAQAARALLKNGEEITKPVMDEIKGKSQEHKSKDTN